MKRRNFITNNLALGAILPASYTSLGYGSVKQDDHPLLNQGDPFIEKVIEGRPSEGKVLAVIQPHCDDIPIFAAGTVAKLIYEGYTGYLIRTTNDEAAGAGNTSGERFLNNERDNAEVAKALGLKKTYDLNYANHRMDEYNIQEIKGMIHGDYMKKILIIMLRHGLLKLHDGWPEWAVIIPNSLRSFSHIR